MLHVTLFVKHADRSKCYRCASIIDFVTTCDNIIAILVQCALPLINSSLFFLSTAEPAYAATAAPSNRQPVPSYTDYLSLSNYNTAPRGWKKGETVVYRPVTFFNSKPTPVRGEDTRRKSFTDF